MCFQGTNIVNSGFTVPAAWATGLIRESPKYEAVLKPLCEGAALNAIWDGRWPRWIVDFQDWPLQRAREFPKCLDIVTKTVKPQRDASNRARYRTYWWQFGERQVGLYEKASGLAKVIVIAYTSNTLAFAFLPAGGLIYYNCTVICSNSDGFFACLQSSLHQAWVREFGSTLKGDARYAPERCFETYPFPPMTKQLEETGRAYAAYREGLVAARREGLTKTYNRLHAAGNVHEGIAQLRDLQVRMDTAAAAAFGWDDLKLGHGLHTTTHGARFTISDTARREVLKRLLELNGLRYADEVSSERAATTPGARTKKVARPTTALQGKE